MSTSILIKDTTPMERIQIVKDSLDGEYDEMYDDYVDGRRELSEINSDCANSLSYSIAEDAMSR